VSFIVISLGKASRSGDRSAVALADVVDRRALLLTRTVVGVLGLVRFARRLGLLASAFLSTAATGLVGLKGSRATGSLAVAGS
jgi:hypothetical protein